MKRVIILITTLLFVATASLAIANEDSPTAQLQSTIDKVLEVLNTEVSDKPAHIADAIKPRFDFEKMAQLTLHKYWQDQSPENKQEFVRLFSKMLEKTYITKVSMCSSPEIKYVRERQRGNKAEVETNVISNGKAIKVNYRMYMKDREWKIYDIKVEGVSLVRNYRNQLTGMLKTKSFTTLLTTLEQKVS